MTVYFHRNQKTLQVFYVGIGNNNRPYQFYDSSRNRLWHRIVKKYGEPIVEIVHSGLSKKRACAYEMVYIRRFGLINNGGRLCNMTYGGETSPMNNKYVAEKVHSQLRGRERPDMKTESNPSKKPENRERARLAMIVVRQNITKEQKEKQRETARVLFKTRNPLFNPLIKEKILRQQRKAVIQMDKDENDILGHISINDAGRSINKSASKIYMCCAGKRKTAYGFKWKYAS